MKKKTTSCIQANLLQNSFGLLLLLILSCLSGNAIQAQSAYDIYPALPFDLAATAQAGNNKTTIWLSRATATESDVAGQPWSNIQQQTYLWQRYEYVNGKMELETTYLSTGDKQQTQEYFYRDQLLSATEILQYDSLQKSKQAGGLIYLYYKDNKPFQRVRTFGFPNHRVRLLDEFVFDEQHRITKQKTTATGQGPDMSKLLDGMQDKAVRKVVYKYQDSILICQQYNNLYSLQDESTTTYNEQQLPQKTVLTNTAGKVIVATDYEYEGTHCTKKIHWIGGETNETVLTIYKIEYFEYDNGLIVRHLTEENGVQTVLDYNHFLEEK